MHKSLRDPKKKKKKGKEKKKEEKEEFVDLFCWILFHDFFIVSCFGQLVGWSLACDSCPLYTVSAGEACMGLAWSWLHLVIILINSCGF